MRSLVPLAVCAAYAGIGLSPFCPSPAAAQTPPTYVLKSDDAVIYDLVGTVRVEPGGEVSFKVGPRHTYTVGGPSSDVAQLNGGPEVDVEIGPIDYPDSYQGAKNAPRFINRGRTIARDPIAPNDPSKFEWYCLACSFRPWMDTGNAKTVTVTFMRKGSRARHVTAKRHGDLWITTRALPRGWRARVSPGAIKDAWGDRNSAASAVARRR